MPKHTTIFRKMRQWRKTKSKINSNINVINTFVFHRMTCRNFKVILHNWIEINTATENMINCIPENEISKQ